MIIGLIFISIAFLLASYICYKEWCNRRSLKPGSVFVEYDKNPNPFFVGDIYAYIVVETKKNVNGKLWVKYVALKENRYGYDESENRYRDFLEGKRYVKKDDFYLHFSDSFIEKINETVSNIKAEEK